MDTPELTRRDHQQARALASYGRTAYQKLNMRLRNGEQLTGQMQHMYECLMGFMQTLEQDRAMYRQRTLYRGGILPERFLDEGIWQEPAFTSTSLDHHIAHYFIGDERGKISGMVPVFMTIMPDGALALSLNQILGQYEKESGKQLDYMRHEKETILAVDTIFSLRKLQKKRDMWYDLPVWHLHLDATAS